MALLAALRKIGAGTALLTLLSRNPAAKADPTNIFILHLLEELHILGDNDALRVLAERAQLRYPFGIADVLRELYRLVDEPWPQEMAIEVAARIDLADASGVSSVLDVLLDAGDEAAATALLDREPAAHIGLREPGGVTGMLTLLHCSGHDKSVRVLLAREPALHVALTDPHGVAGLLRALRRLRDLDAVQQLLARRPAAHVELANPSGLAALVRSLRSTGDREAARSLATRAATHASVSDYAGGEALTLAMSQVGAAEEARTYARRLQDAGTGRREDFGQYGRETDGRAAQPWTWDDLHDQMNPE
ncbi:hypothetical protein ACFVHB_15940 [Kitasatospora sp. NPDC127111]|uniref:hypothetical protein n=1 Tax=Kitasatospora sp. NPDC127111 TaxID=3345363 RepID=UPI00362FFC7F